MNTRRSIGTLSCILVEAEEIYKISNLCDKVLCMQSIPDLFLDLMFEHQSFRVKSVHLIARVHEADAGRLGFPHLNRKHLASWTDLCEERWRTFTKRLEPRTFTLKKWSTSLNADSSLVLPPIVTWYQPEIAKVSAPYHHLYRERASLKQLLLKPLQGKLIWHFMFPDRCRSAGSQTPIFGVEKPPDMGHDIGSTRSQILNREAWLKLREAGAIRILREKLAIRSSLNNKEPQVNWRTSCYISKQIWLRRTEEKNWNVSQAAMGSPFTTIYINTLAIFI